MLVAVNGTRLFVDCEGPQWVPEGAALRCNPSLLVLHGGPGVDHAAYRDLGRALAADVHVVYMDHRANGRSEGGEGLDLTLEDWAADVHGVIAALGLERPIVLGHSFGGYVAQAYGAAYPDEPGGLVLAGTAPRFVLERSLSAFERLGGREAVETARSFFAAPAAHFGAYMARCYPLYAKTPPDPEVLARTVLRVPVADAFVKAGMQRFDLRPRLGRIRAPVLILSAPDDVIATPEDVAELKGGVRCELSEARFPEAGHEIFRDAPERAAAAVRSFVLARGARRA